MEGRRRKPGDTKGSRPHQKLGEAGRTPRSSTGHELRHPAFRLGPDGGHTVLRAPHVTVALGRSCPTPEGLPRATLGRVWGEQSTRPPRRFVLSRQCQRSVPMRPIQMASTQPLFQPAPVRETQCPWGAELTSAWGGGAPATQEAE